MYRYTLALLFACFLFSGTQCPRGCEQFNSGTAILEVNLENPAERYVIGETLWFSADFSSKIVQENAMLTISEGGGLVVSQLFRVQPDSSIITPGLNAFTPVEDEGMVLPNGPADDPSAALLRYTCENENCAFRQGFRIDSVGTYLLAINGSSFDQTGESLQFCGDPGFGTTILNGGNNLSGVPLSFPLMYQEGMPTTPFQFSFIDTFQQNLFLIHVE